MWITLKLQFYKNRHNIWIVSLKLFFFTTNNWPICTSMYIKMCRPSSFNKTNEKNERNAEKISKITTRPTRTNIKFCLLSLFNHSTKKFSCSWNMKKIYWIKCYMLFPSKFPFLMLKRDLFIQSILTNFKHQQCTKNDMIDEYILQTW